MSELPLGIQTFSQIRENNLLYVDKTAIIHRLITSGKYFFLSRPRRFGKSLLISTLESLFLGKKELFDGLLVADTDYEFIEYPVVKFEFTKVMVRQEEDLVRYLDTQIGKIAAEYEITLERTGFDLRFDELVSRLHHKYQRRVVVLIDEYDKPILANVNTPLLQRVKSVINSFYSVIKSLDEHLHFAFITGVSKFAKVSVFSGMNNLTDISMLEDYAALCGLTEKEVHASFDTHVALLAEKMSVSTDEIFEQISQWYNGYKFHPLGEGVYNPYSVLSLFMAKEFRNFWFETATPTFLLDVMQQNQYDFKNFDLLELGASAFAASEPEDINLPSLLFQTGYLTIKDYHNPLYLLDFPNREVKKSFFESVVTRYGNIDSGMGETFVIRLGRFLKSGDIEQFFEVLSEFFANIPNDITIAQEKYYQSIFYSVFTLLGYDIQAEVSTNRGRIDCVLQTEDTVYIIEFKLNDSKEAALQQIKDKQYPQKYQSSGKQIILLGVEFDRKTRNIGNYLQEIHKM